MLYHNCIAGSLVITISLISLFFLTRTTTHQYQYLMQSTKPRFILFIFLHIYIIIMMILFLVIKQTYNYAKWIFILCITMAVLITTLQITIYLNNRNKPRTLLKTGVPIQLAYLNCYFLIYMYSLIGAFISMMFLLCTSCCIYWQDRRIRRAIKQSIHVIAYNQQTMHDRQCAICISPLKHQQGKSQDSKVQYQRLLEIKCNHVFHQQCLLEWIRVNQSCPTCRYNIFQGIQEEEDIGVYVIRNQ